LSMSVANATGCVLRDDIAKPGSLTGVAYVTTSPVAGKTKRLQWVAITSEGRGLSFRADRWGVALKFPHLVSNLKRSFLKPLAKSNRKVFIKF
jgi:hypothetical protein